MLGEECDVWVGGGGGSVMVDVWVGGSVTVDMHVCDVCSGRC